MLRISKRLEMIAGGVPTGSRLADIGSDHALLPVYLAQKKQIVKAVAGEVNLGPFQAASRQVRDSVLDQVIDVRHGNGLEVVKVGEIDVITIAGMGGALIADILEAGKDKLAGVQLLILQPNVGESNVRSWLIQQDWILINEQILEEDGKIYEILSAVPSHLSQVSNVMLYRERQLADGVTVNRELLLKLGPYLLDHPQEVWFQKWESELEKLAMIVQRLALSALPESRMKELEYQQEIERIREVLACLQKDKPSFN
ncbi:class I SAM-dependent methyltransferase [Paenibacillus sp. FSL H7-0331]|uniref:tRNA (adenine(22)-N(1))-methyltransferase n=1 Tax=Paenibacillus sp. FSL H7-0331 TaxID=1920421 RepID=UPI00096D2799|nr:class I SAM-dependent methyltransferase [Paenibacillus sp. FSL H7-0331]OMF18336.1 tRNA (adenine-N(1))-methyltransferase [Paenibacillus sp. FSL H7-0331]